MVNKQWDIEVVGVLAPDDYVAEKIDRQPIFINSQNSLQFLIKIISETPDSFPNANLFTGYCSDIEPYGFTDDYLKSNFDRIQSLRNFFEHRLVIFRPIKRGDHFHIRDVRLEHKPQAYTDKTTFVPVPVFNERKHKMTFNQFKEKLITKKFVGKIDYVSNEPDDTPRIVLWEREENSYFVIGEFDSHRYAYGGFLFEYSSLKICEFQEDWFNEAVEIPKNETVLFIGNDTYQIMLKELESSSLLEKEVEQQTVVSQEKELKLEPKISTKDEQTSEQAFIKLLISYASEQGLLYDEKDLINFHTAMKSSSLVILSGMSGTGKSKLVQVYGRALGMDDTQLNIIPVRPSWTDDADLIGYVDSIHMVYRPGDSGLIDTLIDAAKEENLYNRVYIICFDEMNLARVEHYFSQFLSVLEMDPSRRQLRLYNEGLESRLYNSERYKPVVPIGENVMFVGTVNIDESTYHFSDKVLDRSNVISLKVLPFDKLKDIKDEKKKKPEEWSFAQYRNFKNQSVTYDLNDRETALLENLHSALQSVSKNLGIGYRIVRQIDNYLKNLPQNEFLNREDAFDLQVVQRILTKVRGPEDQLKKLIGTIHTETGALNNSIFIDILESFEDVSRFYETKKIILHKANELRMYGYTV